jgi:hypothetical protein
MRKGVRRYIGDKEEEDKRSGLSGGNHAFAKDRNEGPGSL